jgi:hypothetical protein
LESELKKIERLVKIDLMTRRLEIHKEDPMDELLEVYQDVKEIENNLKRTIKIAFFMIEKNNALF